MKDFPKEFILKEASFHATDLTKKQIIFYSDGECDFMADKFKSQTFSSGCFEVKNPFSKKKIYIRNFCDKNLLY